MKASKQSEPLVSAKVIASHLSVSSRTVYLWAKQGKLPYYLIGESVRFKLSEIEKFIASVRCASYSEL